MKAILFDLDGVLYNDEQPIPGAADAIRWIESRKIPHLFVTNTSTRGPEALVQKLARFGIPAGPEQILTPSVAAAAWLRVHATGPVALFVQPPARPVFEGIPLVPESAETGAKYVVVGDLEESWNFHTLNRAFRLLHSDPEAVIIALGMTRFWRANDGLRLDVAPFVALLECASARKAVVFGKPAAAFYEAATETLGVEKTEVLMIGDDIEVDVGGAQRAGLLGALVKTGKFRPSSLEGGIRPDAVLDSVADLPRLWETQAAAR
ncbi:MAG: TIGR01458 family HAD-type hydrolase [Bryobacteraceae bacterium]